MSARWWTFIVWALVAGSTLAWGLKVFVQPPQAPAQALVAQAGPVGQGNLTRLLGNDPPPPPPVAAAAEPAADARFKLVGVVSPRSPQAAREGLALIAVDGRPPRAYRVGTLVVEPHVLQGVDARGATLGPRGGTALIALELPPPAAAATGVLPQLQTLQTQGSAAGPPGRSPPAYSPVAPVQPPGLEDDEPPPDDHGTNRAPLR